MDTASAGRPFEAAGLKEITLITTDHPWTLTSRRRSARISRPLA